MGVALRDHCEQDDIRGQGKLKLSWKVEVYLSVLAHNTHICRRILQMYVDHSLKAAEALIRFSFRENMAGEENTGQCCQGSTTEKVMKSNDLRRFAHL